MALISADELGRLLDANEEALRVVDVRWYLNQPGAGRRAYEAGHIPGARNLPFAELYNPDGTFRSPAIFPMIVAARKSGRKSSVIAGFTSGLAQVASVVLPAATAALRASATSGVESAQRCSA